MNTIPIMNPKKSSAVRLNCSMRSPFDSIVTAVVVDIIKKSKANTTLMYGFLNNSFMFFI